MIEDFLDHAGMLTTEEINNLISNLNQIKENRADEARRAAAQKVKEAIDEYLKLGGEISINGEVWDEDSHCDENIEATFDSCFEEGGYLTFIFK